MDHKSLPKSGFVHSAILKALWSKPSLCVRKLRDRGLQICPVSTVSGGNEVYLQHGQDATGEDRRPLLQLRIASFFVFCPEMHVLQKNASSRSCCLKTEGWQQGWGWGCQQGVWLKVISSSGCGVSMPSQADLSLSPSRLPLFRYLNPFSSAPWLFQGHASYSDSPSILRLIPDF